MPAARTSAELGTAGPPPHLLLAAGTGSHRHSAGTLRAASSEAGPSHRSSRAGEQAARGCPARKRHSQGTAGPGLPAPSPSAALGTPLRTRASAGAAGTAKLKLSLADLPRSPPQPRRGGKSLAASTPLPAGGFAGAQERMQGWQRTFDRNARLNTDRRSAVVLAPGVRGNHLRNLRSLDTRAARSLPRTKPPWQLFPPGAANGAGTQDLPLVAFGSLLLPRNTRISSTLKSAS